MNPTRAARVIDMTIETKRWGHNLHALTMRECIPATARDRVLDWIRKTRRYTVLAHLEGQPGPGDILRYTGADNHPRRATISAVENLRNPPDMWKLEFINPEPESTT